MNKIDRNRTIRILRDKTEEFSKNKEEALGFLIRAGICNKEGKLTDEYKFQCK